MRLSRLELLLGAITFLSCAYFFPGGGWNQSAHFATTVALFEDGSVVLDRFRDSTGDLSQAGAHVVANKPIATALAALPAYALGRLLSAGVDNPGNQLILRAYVTTTLTMGLALTVLAIVFFRLLRLQLDPSRAAWLSLGAVLATPLWPHATRLSAHVPAVLAILAAWLLVVRRPVGVSQSATSGEVQGGEGGRAPSPENAASSPWADPSVARLFGAGLLVGLGVAFEYAVAVVVPWISLYVLWRLRHRRRVAAYIGGGLVAAALPALHHTLVFGHPLATAYDSLVVKEFADWQKQGVFGFDGLSFSRLFELTLGQSRGAFFLSPFLLAAIPGARRWLANPERRPEALALLGMALSNLLLFAACTYWHSGSSIGSRYTLVFVALAALLVAQAFSRARAGGGWIMGGMAIGFAVMLLLNTVTPMPPAPRAPPYPNVVTTGWDRFANDQILAFRQPMLLEAGKGAGQPTWPLAFNLGQLMGLRGRGSVVPYLLGLLVGLVALARLLGRPTVVRPAGAPGPASAPSSPSTPSLPTAPGSANASSSTPAALLLLAALGVAGTSGCSEAERVELAATAAAPAVPTSTMLCRAGPTISITSRYDLNFAYTWVAAGGSQGYEIFGNMAVNFQGGRAPLAAGLDGKTLPAGTCAFADRPLAADEPSRVSYSGRFQPGLTMVWSTHLGQTGAPQLSSPLDDLGRDSGKILRARVSRDGEFWKIGDFELL